MLVDCFTYFEEKELLLLRYEMLKDVVDFFLITDGDRTFKGDPKPYHCLNHLKELGIKDDRIQVLHTELPSKEEIHSPWIREYAQRDALGVGMAFLQESTDKECVFHLSDVDEIPKPDYLKHAELLVREDPHRCVRFSMPMLYARGDFRVIDPARSEEVSPNTWVGGTVFSHKKLYMRVSEIRRTPNETDVVLGARDAGWHFSWMGSKERQKLKLGSFSHCYDNIPNSVAPADSQEMLDYIDNYEPKEGERDILGRTDHILTKYDTKLLPPEVFELDLVRNFLLPEDN